MTSSAETGGSAVSVSKAAAALVLGLVACGEPAPQAPTRGVDEIDDARLVDAVLEAESWLTHGGSYAEQRYCSLAQIHESNVSQLGLAFFVDTSRSTAAGSTSARSTAASSRSTQRRASWSGRSSPSTRVGPTPSPWRRAW
jgi:glucose dehydrogenase